MSPWVSGVKRVGHRKVVVGLFLLGTTELPVGPSDGECDDLVLNDLRGGRGSSYCVSVGKVEMVNKGSASSVALSYNGLN